MDILAPTMAGATAPRSVERDAGELDAMAVMRARKCRCGAPRRLTSRGVCFLGPPSSREVGAGWYLFFCLLASLLCPFPPLPTPRPFARRSPIENTQELRNGTARSSSPRCQTFHPSLSLSRRTKVGTSCRATVGRALKLTNRCRARLDPREQLPLREAPRI